MPSPVTDTATLARLNAASRQEMEYVPVADPELLARLNATGNARATEFPSARTAADQFASGFNETVGRVAGLPGAALNVLVPGQPFSDSSTIVENMRTGNPNTLGGRVFGPVVSSPPRTGVERFSRLAGENVAATVASGGVALATRVPGPLAALRESILTKPLRTVAREVTMSGLVAGGQTAGHEFGPAGEVIGGLSGAVIPLGLQVGGAAALRGAFRGGDTGRGRIEDVLQTFDRLNVRTPTAGTAAMGLRSVGTPRLRTFETALESIPGGYAPLHDSVTQVQKQIGDRIRVKVQFLGPDADETTSGRAIYAGINQFIERFRFKSGQAYSNLDALIPPGTKGPATNTVSHAQDLLRKIPGAEETSEALRSPEVQKLALAIVNDVQLGGGELPYEALAGLRSVIGDKLTSPEWIFASGPGRADLKRMYGFLSADMAQIAKAQGPAAEAAYKTASTYYARNIKLVDELAETMAKKGATPEHLHQWAISGTDLGASRLSQLRKAMTPDQWAVVQAVELKKMGLPHPGQQDAFGEGFSFQRFLTDYNRMDDRAKDLLFKGGKADLRPFIDDIAIVSDVMRRAGGVMANPSGTARRGMFAFVLFSVLGAPTAAVVAANTDALTGAMTGLATIGGATLASNKTAKLMSNPEFIRWLGQSTKVSPRNIPGHVARLANISGDPETMEILAEYAELVRSETQ